MLISPKRVLTGVALAVVATAAAGYVLADDRGSGISQSGEQRNMRRVGHVDLQGRSRARTAAAGPTRSRSAPRWSRTAR